MDIGLDERTGARVRKSGSSRLGTGGVQSLIRALSILDVLAENDDGLTLTAVVNRVCLPPSTVHRLLTTLQQKRFVRFEPNGLTWRVGVQSFVVGAAFARSREVAPIALPFMRQLMEKSGEAVNLYVRNERQAICIAQSSAARRYAQSPGRAAACRCSARPPARRCSPYEQDRG